MCVMQRKEHKQMCEYNILHEVHGVAFLWSEFVPTRGLQLVLCGLYKAVFFLGLCLHETVNMLKPKEILNCIWNWVLTSMRQNCAAHSKAQRNMATREPQISKQLLACHKERLNKIACRVWLLQYVVRPRTNVLCMFLKGVKRGNAQCAPGARCCLKNLCTEKFESRSRWNAVGSLTSSSIDCNILEC